MRPALLLVVLVAPLGAQEKPHRFAPKKEREAFLLKMEKKMARVRSFVADFDQEKTLTVFKNPVKSSGVILFSKTGQLRWEIKKPFRSILIVDGTSVAKFEYVGGKRRKLELGRARDAILLAMEQVRSWFKGDFDRKGKQYEVNVVLEPAPLIVLTPRSKAMRKSLGALEFSPSEDLTGMRRVTIREKAGKTVMIFKNRKDGITPPANAFSLKNPAELDSKKLRATAK